MLPLNAQIPPYTQSDSPDVEKYLNQLSEALPKALNCIQSLSSKSDDNLAIGNLDGVNFIIEGLEAILLLDRIADTFKNQIFYPRNFDEAESRTRP
jgi:hypothetical protein